MKTIAITGATGFVGAHLVRYFSKKPGFRVLALGRSALPPTGLAAFAEYFQADLDAPIAPIDCDFCIHAAAIADDHAPLEQLRKTNVDGTKNLLDAMHGCRVFVQISSSSVYDLRNEVHFEDEKVDSRLLSNYGKTKREAEIVLKNHPRRPDSAIVLRPRAIYGTGDRVLLPRILQTWKNGKITVPGGLRVASSMTNIENLIAAIEAGLSAQLIGFQCFNVADDKNYLLRDVFVKLLESIFRQKLTIRELPPAPLFWLARFFKKAGFKIKLTAQSLAYLTKPAILDCSKIRNELGVVFEKNFEDTLPEMVDWVEKTGRAAVIRGDQDLPWRS